MIHPQGTRLAKENNKRKSRKRFGFAFEWTSVAYVGDAIY